MSRREDYELHRSGDNVAELLTKVENLARVASTGNYNDLFNKPSIPSTAGFITKTVNDLVYYYTKSEVYNKTEVDQIVSTIKQFTIRVVDALPHPPTMNTMNILYLVPSAEPRTNNEKDEFITVEKDGGYAWEQVGSTAVDLSGYVTIDSLNDTLENYVTQDDFDDYVGNLCAVRYISQQLTSSQKATARDNIGATAPEVFWAEYGVTTAAEIDTAVTAGKVVVARYGGSDYLLSKHANGEAYYYFGNILGSSFNWLRLQVSNNTWAAGVQGAEVASNKSQSVETDKTSTSKYPSTKAVADFVAGNDKVFIAEYGTTTFAEITNALADGKVVVVMRVLNSGTDNENIVFYGGPDNVFNFAYVFSRLFFDPDGRGSTTEQIGVGADDIWGEAGQKILEDASYKVSSWSPVPNDYQYPTEKLVKDSLDGKQPTIDAQHKLDYSLIANTPTIPVLESMTASEVTNAVNTAWDNVMNA